MSETSYLVTPKTDFIQAGAILEKADLLICYDCRFELGNHFYLKDNNCE